MPSCLLLTAFIAVYLIGNGRVALWDRDEPRYAQTSKQMLQSGDWVVPILLDEPREKKPIFIYWCQAAAMSVLGTNEFAARLPSVIGVMLTLIVLGVAISRDLGPRRGFWTVFVFGTAGLTMAAAKMCITDGVLILFTTIAQLCLYQVYRGRGTSGTFIVMGLAVGLGILTKGPVVLGVMGMTLLTLAAMRFFFVPSPGTPGEGAGAGSASGLDTLNPTLTPALSRRTGRGGTVMKSVIAAAIALAVVVPWLYAIEQRLPGYTLRTLYQEVFVRAGQAQEGHSGPPGYYLLVVWGIFLPWSIFLPPTMLRAWRLRHRPRVRFALASIIGPWIMFEIVQTKLPHYILPVFPALAMLTADWLIVRTRSQNDALRRWALTLGSVMLVGVAILYGLVLPRIDALRISPRVADILIREGATNPGDVIMIDYKEDSLPFYQGGTIRPQRNDKYLADTPVEQWPRWIVLTSEIWDQTPGPVRQQLDIVGTVGGLNQAGHPKVVEVMVVRKRQEHQ